MLTAFFCICIYRVAEMDKRRGWLWASINLLISALLQLLILPGYWGAVTAVVTTSAVMIGVNFKHPVKKGPTLR